MSHANLVQYAIRLTTIVAAFTARERQLRFQDGKNDDSDDDGTTTGSRGSVENTPDSLTASLRSIRLPPVRTTREVHRATDFEGNKTINEYSIIAELGRGAYGKVKLAVNNATNQTCAIKIMKKSVLKHGTGEAVVMREIAVMKKLRHQNVVHLMEVLDDPEAEKIYLVMKYIDSGTMVHIKSDLTCNPLPLKTATNYLRQLVSGLTYLHQHGVIHRDLKPDNIMLDSAGIVYLTDFGVSEIVASDSAAISGTEGTPVFLAPELLKSAESSSDASGVDSLLTGRPLAPPPSSGKASSSAAAAVRVKGPPVDVWALGVTFYFAIFGKAPFSGKSWMDIADKVVHDEVAFPPGADPVWVDVLTKLLNKDPKRRLTLSQLKRHRLFDEINRAKAEVGEISVMGASHFPAPEGDHSPMDDDMVPLRPLELTDEEVQGSMRRVPHPINEDESAFTKISQRVRSQIGSFVQGLRTRVAAKTLASIGRVDGGDGQLVLVKSMDHEFDASTEEAIAAVANRSGTHDSKHDDADDGNFARKIKHPTPPAGSRGPARRVAGRSLPANDEARVAHPPSPSSGLAAPRPALVATAGGASSTSSGRDRDDDVDKGLVQTARSGGTAARGGAPAPGGGGRQVRRTSGAVVDDTVAARHVPAADGKAASGAGAAAAQRRTASKPRAAAVQPHTARHVSGSRGGSRAVAAVKASGHPPLSHHDESDDVSASSTPHLPAIPGARAVASVNSTPRRHPPL